MLKTDTHAGGVSEFYSGILNMKYLHRLCQFWLGIFAVVFGLASTAHATDDTTISDTVTSLTTGFGLIKGLVITVVVFSLIIGYVKLLKKR